MAELTIGQVAKRAGVHVETIRYYQRLGLVELPPKPMYGFRRYDDEAVRRLLFIKRAQKMGFTLKEIAELLSVEDCSCDKVRQLLHKKLDHIESKIKDMEHMREILQRGIETCDGDPKAGCQVLYDLMTGA